MLPVQAFIAFLPAPAWDATRQFYSTILGLPCVLEQVDCCIYQVAGTGYLGFCQREAVPQPAERVILTLVTDAVDAWHQHLRQQGVEVVKPPTFNERYQIYHMFVRDPNGYLVEIQRFEDPRWAAHLSTTLPPH